MLARQGRDLLLKLGGKRPGLAVKHMQDDLALSLELAFGKTFSPTPGAPNHLKAGYKGIDCSAVSRNVIG